MLYIKNPSFTGSEYWEDDSDRANRVWPDMDHPYHPKSQRDRAAKTPVGRAMQMYAEEVFEQHEQNGGENDGELVEETNLVDGARHKLAQIFKNGTLFLDATGKIEVGETASLKELEDAKEAFSILRPLQVISGRKKIESAIESIETELRLRAHREMSYWSQEMTDEKNGSFETPQQLARFLMQLISNLNYLKWSARDAYKRNNPSEAGKIREELRIKCIHTLVFLNELREKNPDKLLEIIVQHYENQSRLRRDNPVYDPDLCFDLNAYKRALVCYLQTHEIRFSEKVLQECGINYSASVDSKYEARRGEKTFAQMVRENNSRPDTRKDDPQGFLRAMSRLKSKKSHTVGQRKGPEMQWRFRKKGNMPVKNSPHIIA